MSTLDQHNAALELDEEEDELDSAQAQQGAYEEAAIELAKGIALGAIPFLGQAIDAYDTIESAIQVYQAPSAASKEEAQFDLVLAIIGWVPGPGDGVKKSLRLVNSNPERFAPVLFDLLRFVLNECGIRTSPEELLSKIFDASALQGQLDEVISGVKDSSAFDALPNSLQSVVLNVLVVARDNFPAMLGIVERRLLKWRGKQRNNSAMTSGSGKVATNHKPAGQAADNTERTDSPGSARSNTTDNQQPKELSVKGIANNITGIIGEHIADYYCYEELGWGKGWEAHDDGGAGVWNAGNPSAIIPGKLSKGGSPKDFHKLTKLTDPSFGTGIDAVWCTNGHNNDGKQFAIIDAKASNSGKKPKYMDKAGNSRKPGISSKLEGSGTGKNRVVQMSHEWIMKNIKKAVSISLLTSIKRRNPDGTRNYSRHILYTPVYSPSLLAHLESTLEENTHQKHEEHDGLHYTEEQIQHFVEKAKTRERRKYPGAYGLRKSND